MTCLYLLTVSHLKMYTLKDTSTEFRQKSTFSTKHAQILKIREYKISCGQFVPRFPKIKICVSQTFHHCNKHPRKRLEGTKIYSGSGCQRSQLVGSWFYLWILPVGRQNMMEKDHGLAQFLPRGNWETELKQAEERYTFSAHTPSNRLPPNKSDLLLSPFPNVIIL